jgi:hypothetical protein
LYQLKPQSNVCSKATPSSWEVLMVKMKQVLTYVASNTGAWVSSHSETTLRADWESQLVNARDTFPKWETVPPRSSWGRGLWQLSIRDTLATSGCGKQGGTEGKNAGQSQVPSNLGI